MSMQFVKASASDALTLTEISKKAFDSDVQVGAPSAGGPPDYMSVPFHAEMAKSNHLYKLTDNGLIVGGAVLFLDKDKLYVGRIFVSPEHHRKGYGSCIMREIEAAFSEVKEIALDTPIWNVRTNAFYLKLGYVEVKRDNELIYYSKKRDV